MSPLLPRPAALRAATFHARRSADLVIRLGDGTDESHRRMQEALDEFWIFTGELFEVDESDEALHAAGVVPDARTLLAPWREQVTGILAKATRLRSPPLNALIGFF